MGEIEAALARKQDLETILSSEGSYSKMKSEVPKKKDVDAFIKMLKTNKFEAALLQALPPVLAKEPATRTEFDSLVLSNLEEAITTEISKLDKVVQDLVLSKEERTGAATFTESAV